MDEPPDARHAGSATDKEDLFDRHAEGEALDLEVGSPAAWSDEGGVEMCEVQSMRRHGMRPSVEVRR